MKFSRLLWLSAWAVWLWLGFGLHRELPRDWGPAHLKLPMQFVGFLHNSDFVVCHATSHGREFHSFDARTGARIHDRSRIAVEGQAGAISLRHGLGIGFHFDAWLSEAKNDGLHSFNFRTGEWKRLDVKPGRVFDVHAAKPWIAVRLQNGDRNAPRVAVIDVVEGKTVGLWESNPPPANSIDFIQDCWFAGDGDELVIVIERNAAAERGSAGVVQRFEHWSVAKGPIREPVRLNRVYYRTMKPAGGRIAMMGFAGKPDAVEVLDHRTGRSLLSSESHDLDSGGQRRTYPLEPMLSPSGKTLLSRSNSLWSIDERRPLWRGRQSVEEVVSAQTGSSRFGVLEDWSSALGRLGRTAIRWTFAIRDFATGAVCYRVWGTGPESKDFDPAVRFALLKREIEGPSGPEPEFVVVDAIPNVNWTLFAICQGVLAAPIVLLWLALRWRRRRRLLAQRRRELPETS